MIYMGSGRQPETVSLPHITTTEDEMLCMSVIPIQGASMVMCTSIRNAFVVALTAYGDYDAPFAKLDRN